MAIRIMVVEDESIIAKDIRQSVESFGYSVTSTVASGEEAVARAGAERPDLVLMDIMLKGSLDGIGAAREIRDKYNIPIIYITAYDDEKTLARAKLTEPFGYLLKPFRDRELYAAIEMALYKMNAERAIKEAEMKLRTIMSAVLDAIILVDSDEAIIYWNAAAEKMFGFSSGEMAGKQMCGAIIPERYVDLHKKGFQRFRETGGGSIVGRTMEFTAVRKGGEEFPVELSVSPIKIRDSWHAVGIVRDITERKGFERDLLKSKYEAVEASRLKDKFVSIVAHDLREPLSSIWGFLEILKNQSPGAGQVATIYDVMAKSTSRMLELIEELLTVGRIKTGVIKPKYAFCDAFHIAAKAVSEFCPLAERKGVELVNSIKERTRVYVDEILLSTVLRNLISNAIKFSHKDGVITVFTPENRPGAIAVSDTGIGINPKSLAQIFRYDEKTSTSGTSGEKGSGLGLPLCRDIIAAHGGSIDVESKVGEGSAFYITLPAMKPFILIVEDEPISAKKIRSLLADIDVETAIASDGVEAMDMVRERPPHLILLDLYMPRMDGFEFIQQIKRKPKLEDIPVIVLTAHGEMENREKAFRLGAADFAVKPLAADDIIPRIRRFIP